MRDLKKNKSVTVTLYLQICRNGCFWNKRKQFSMKTKTLSQWKRRSGRNGIAPTGHKCTENPETLSKFLQHRFQILIKTESGSS